MKWLLPAIIFISMLHAEDQTPLEVEQKLRESYYRTLYDKKQMTKRKETARGVAQTLKSKKIYRFNNKPIEIRSSD